MTNTTFVPPALKAYRRQLAFNACVQHIEQNGGQAARGGYACIVVPDHDNKQDITVAVPLRRKSEAKNYKKRWRKEGLGGSYFHITCEVSR